MTIAWTWLTSCIYISSSFLAVIFRELTLNHQLCGKASSQTGSSPAGLDTGAQRTGKLQELVDLYQVLSAAFAWPRRLLRGSWFSDMTALVFMYQPHAECFFLASMPQTKFFHSLTVSILTVFCKTWLVIKCCIFLSPKWIQLKGNFKYLPMSYSHSLSPLSSKRSEKNQRIHFPAVCKIGFSGIL